MVELQVVVRAKRARSIDYAIVFRKDGCAVARGELTVVCVTRSADGGFTPCPLPDEVDARIEAAPLGVLDEL